MLIPNLCCKAFSIYARHLVETGGMIYGLKHGNTAYLAKILPYLETNIEKRSVIRFEMKEETLEKFAEMHNNIVEAGQKRSRKFIAVPFHNHPRLEIEEFPKPDYDRIEKELNKGGRKMSQENFERYFTNEYLSQNDIKFAERYGSLGLTIILVGRTEDPLRSDGVLNLYRRYTQIFFKTLSGKPDLSRIRGYQVRGNGDVKTLDLEVAEHSSGQIDWPLMQEAYNITSHVTEPVNSEWRRLLEIYPRHAGFLTKLLTKKFRKR